MATLREHIDRIHKEIPIARVLADLGYAVRSDGGLREQQFSCDLHGDGRDNKPSARVYPESASFYCFACGMSRDAVALIQAKEGLTLREAIRRLETSYELPPIPWGDERPSEASDSLRVSVQSRLNLTHTFQEDLRALYSSMTWITQERVLMMDQTLSFWEALDQVAYRVKEGEMPETTGHQVLLALQSRLDKALRGEQ